jgi:hypothetical protein
MRGVIVSCFAEAVEAGHRVGLFEDIEKPKTASPWHPEKRRLDCAEDGEIGARLVCLFIAVDDFDILAAVEGAVGGVGFGEEGFDFEVGEDDEPYDGGDDEEGDGDEEGEDDEEDEEED